VSRVHDSGAVCLGSASPESSNAYSALRFRLASRLSRYQPTAVHRGFFGPLPRNKRPPGGDPGIEVSHSRRGAFTRPRGRREDADTINGLQCVRHKAPGVEQTPRGSLRRGSLSRSGRSGEWSTIRTLDKLALNSSPDAANRETRRPSSESRFLQASEAPNR